MRALLTATVLTIAIAFAPSTAAGASIGLTDTFQDGTTDGWFAGGGPFGQVPPVPPQMCQRADPRVPATGSFRSHRVVPRELQAVGWSR